MTETKEIEVPIKAWFWKRNKVRAGLEKAHQHLANDVVSIMKLDYVEHRKFFFSTFYVTFKGTLRGFNALLKGVQEY